MWFGLLILEATDRNLYFNAILYKSSYREFPSHESAAIQISGITVAGENSLGKPTFRKGHLPIIKNTVNN